MCAMYASHYDNTTAACRSFAPVLAGCHNCGSATCHGALLASSGNLPLRAALGTLKVAALNGKVTCLPIACRKCGNRGGSLPMFACCLSSCCCCYFACRTC